MLSFVKQQCFTAILCFLPFFTIAQNEPTAYVVSDEYNMWNLSVGETVYTFAENSYLRDYPDLRGKVIDSVSAGTAVKILSQPYGGNLVKGFFAPWQEISYSKNNVQKKAFIWIGLLALGTQKDNAGNIFLYGFDRFNPAKSDSSSSTYSCSVKLFDAHGDLLGRHPFNFDYLDQGFTECKLLSGMGLTGIVNVFRVSFLGEACGVPSDYFYAGWTGASFVDMPGRSSVSDAGVFYHDEQILFPSEHKNEANMIYRLTEIGVAEDYDDNDTEINYKITKKKEQFFWNGEKFVRPVASK